MNRRRFIMVLIGVFATIAVTYTALRRPTVPRDTDVVVDPLVAQVRIIPGPTDGQTDVPESDSILVGARADLHAKPPSLEGTCLGCHFPDQFPEDGHPGGHLDRHPVERFGCVLCHGGDGLSREAVMAHQARDGLPFLSGAQTESSCGRCHLEPAVPGALHLSGGRFALYRYGCIDCHSLGVSRPASRYAPSLDHTGTKLSPAWLDAWLRDPGGRMPRVEMTDPERRDLVVFLTSLRDDSALGPVEGLGNPDRGGRIYREHNCRGCHRLDGDGETTGPELTNVGEKVDRLWLLNYLKEPARFHPGTIMPDYAFGDQQALDLASFLGVWSERTVSSPGAEAARASHGFRLFVAKGCAQCHRIAKYEAHPLEVPLGAFDQTVERLLQHRARRLPGSGLDLPQADVEVMAVALDATNRSELVENLTYKLDGGTYGDGVRFTEAFWQFPVPFQETPPSYYPNRVSNLDPASCGSCHQEQYADWRRTRHALSMSPGIRGQLIDADRAFVSGCLQCHTPLSEQYDYLPSSTGSWVTNERFDSTLQSHGLVCASCHVRAHQRFGPPFSAVRSSAAVIGEGHHGGAVTSAAYEDSRFCSPCHQFDEGGVGLNGKLLENTYNEWLQSPQARAGQTCQTCHMPDRRHTWKGIHDPDMVRDALELSVDLERNRRAVRARVRLTNEGAGHHLPTYVTPAILVTVRLLDASGGSVPGTEAVRAIQRRVSLLPGDFKELFDTRIPPGGSWVFDYEIERPDEATVIEIRIDVHPDQHYNGFFRDFVASSERAQALIDEAFEITEKSPYHLLTRRLQL